MQKRLLTLVGLGAAALLWASGAAAQPFGPSEGGPGPREGLGGPGRFLELTEEQQAAAREIFERQRPEREAVHEQMRENRKRLDEMLEGGAADPAEVGRLVIEGHALREEGRVLREDSKTAFERLLTEEQLLKLEALEAIRGERGRAGLRGRKGPRSGGRGPHAREERENPGERTWEHDRSGS